MRREPQKASIDQEVDGQPGGRRVTKRTVNRKDDTLWPKAGMWSRESFERLWLRLQEIIMALAPAPHHSGSGSDSGENNPARWLRLLLQILVFCEFCMARLSLNRFDGCSCSSGQNVPARAAPASTPAPNRRSGGSGQQGGC